MAIEKLITWLKLPPLTKWNIEGAGDVKTLDRPRTYDLVITEFCTVHDLEPPSFWNNSLNAVRKNGFFVYMASPNVIRFPAWQGLINMLRGTEWKIVGELSVPYPSSSGGIRHINVMVHQRIL